MPLSYFYAGTFSPLGPVAVWDGTNTSEIVTWVNDVADEWGGWTIESETATELVLVSGLYDQRAHIPMDGWVTVSSSGVRILNQAIHWATPDPRGRPTQVSDAFYIPPA